MSTRYRLAVQVTIDNVPSTTSRRAAAGRQDAYPRATLAILDRAGHRLAAEQSDLLGALAREWQDRVAVPELGRTV